MNREELKTLLPHREPMLLIERTFIRQDGKKIGYSVQFSRGQFGKLQGSSGHHF